MRTAVDTSVLVDLLLDDSKHGQSSQQALNAARRDGSLLVCEVVVAEIGPLLSPEDLRQFLDDLEITFVPCSLEAALLAGQMFQRYLGRGGKRGRVVADFLIGAHAQVHGDRLLARDRGFFRDYFERLTVFH